MDKVPSIHAVRMALESVPGAIRDEPVPEEDGQGADPGTPILSIGDTDLKADPGDSLDEEPSRDDEDREGSSEPNIIFEVPPTLTDADVFKVFGDRLESVRRLAQVKGTDAYGWYVTFHQRARQHGIYIPVEGVVALATHALTSVQLPIDRKLEVAFHAILRHELFHFEADCMKANWELCRGKAIYWGGREEPWHREFEEALANAYMLRGFRHPKRFLKGSGAFQGLKSFCQLQPQGYRDGPRYAASRASYLHGCRDLSFVYACFAEDQWVPPNALDAALLYPDPFHIDWRRCPVLAHDRFGILKTLGIGVWFFETIIGIWESASFLKALARLNSGLQETWHRRKVDLARSTRLNSLGFQRWPPGGSHCYSIRLDGNYRVHLQRDPVRNTWLAESVGDHKAMGHG